MFFRYFEENSLPAETTPFDGGSDYEAFLQAGIPGGGLFSGDLKNKTEAQVQSYGGTAGKDLDSCYHGACDTIGNIDTELLREMSGALAYATATSPWPHGADPGLHGRQGQPGRRAADVRPEPGVRRGLLDS